VKPSKDRSVILPAVMVNRFCDLNIRNIKIRHSLGVRSYHRHSYAASLMDLLCNSKQTSTINGLIINFFQKLTRNFKNFYDATIMLPYADLGTKIFSSVAKNKCFESYRNVKDEGFRYRRSAFFRTDRLQYVYNTYV